MIISRIVTVLFLVLLAGAAFAAVAPDKNSFAPILKLDQTQWKLDNHQEDNNVQLAEYVTGNDTVNQWTQLFTLQKFKFFFNKDLTPMIFAEHEITQLKSQGFDIESKTIENSPQQTIIEFRILNPKNEQQDEIQRVVRTPNGKIIVVHYVIKKTDMGEVERIKWINIIKSLDISFLIDQDEPNTPAKNDNPPQQDNPAKNANDVAPGNV